MSMIERGTGFLVTLACTVQYVSRPWETSAKASNKH